MSRSGFLSVLLCLAALQLAGVQAEAAEKPTRLWNLTSKTITNLQLAPAGTSSFGANQCLNDKDKEVDHDERLKITDVDSGAYDAKVGYEGGRTCLVKGLKVEAGKVFTIEDKDLTDCTK